MRRRGCGSKAHELGANERCAVLPEHGQPVTAPAPVSIKRVKSDGSCAAIPTGGQHMHDLRIGVPVIYVSEHQGTLLVDEHAVPDGEVSG
jgi:hypothetical protein